MRLTQNMMSKTYLSNLNANMKALSSLNERVAADRAYLRASEDPARALKALQVRRSLSLNSIYKQNISEIEGILDEEETAISTINEVVNNSIEAVLQGKNGTLNEESRKVIANTLRNYQEQILSAANTKFGEKYVFGGSATAQMPFTIDSSGNLLYNGQDVNTGTFTDDPKYIDIGIGFSVNAAGEVAPESAFNISYPGSSLLGTGVDANGMSNNLYNLIGQIADLFDANDMTNIQQYADKLDSKLDNVRLQYVSIGEKCNFVDFLKTRYSNDELNLATKQESLEGIETAQGIMDFKTQEAAYNACLQMGAKILQPSLLDYLD